LLINQSCLDVSEQLNNVPGIPLLGMAKVDFDQERFTDAMAKLDTLLKGYPGSAAAPEAVFILGVSGYKSSHNPKPLKDAYERLNAEYPSSEWTTRAHPYSLL
jgi:TolA-binding protein